MADGTFYDTGDTKQNLLNKRDWHNVQSGKVWSPPAATNPDGPDGVASSGDEPDVAATTFTDITPLTGAAAGGTAVRVDGTDLQEITAIRFGTGAPNNGTTFVFHAETDDDDAYITCVQPARAAGTVDIFAVGALVADDDGEGFHKNTGETDTGFNYVVTS